MRDYLTIGPTPASEDCQQVGSDNYDHQLARAELRAFKNQVEREVNRRFGDDIRVTIVIKSFPHDFGSYSEVCAVYNDSDDIATDQAFFCESDISEFWDSEARAELAEFKRNRVPV